MRPSRQLRTLATSGIPRPRRETRGRIAAAGPPVGPEHDLGAPVDGAVPTTGNELDQPKPSPSWLDAVAGVGGPFALAGVALAYLGWVSARAEAAAVGIDVRVLGRQQQEDTLAVLTWLIGPLLLLAAGALLLTVADHWLGSRAGDARLGLPVWLLRGTALICVVLAAQRMDESWKWSTGMVPLLFAGGVGLWLYSVRLAGLWRPREPLPWPVRFSATVLLALLLIWAATEYAIDVGYSRGRESVVSSPSVVLYAEKDLQLALPGVAPQQVPKEPDEPGFSIAYRGVRLLSYTPGERLVLVSEKWAPGSGQVVVLPDDGSIRVEYGPAVLD